MAEKTTQIKSQKKTKDYHLTNNTYNIVLDHQPQGTKENIKNNVDLNSVVAPITDKCFHYHSLTTYNLTLPVITEKKHSNLHKIISSSLVGWGFPIRTEGICEYVVVNVTPDN